MTKLENVGFSFSDYRDGVKFTLKEKRKHVKKPPSREKIDAVQKQLNALSKAIVLKPVLPEKKIKLSPAQEILQGEKPTEIKVTDKLKIIFPQWDKPGYGLEGMKKKIETIQKALASMDEANSFPLEDELTIIRARAKIFFDAAELLLNEMKSDSDLVYLNNPALIKELESLQESVAVYSDPKSDAFSYQNTLNGRSLSMMSGLAPGKQSAVRVFRQFLTKIDPKTVNS